MEERWLWMSAAELGRGIAAGSIDPVALTEALLGAIETHPDARCIYARTTPARARAEAAAAAERARAGHRRGPLDGVPISWKDLYDSAGTRTEAGSALLAGRVPERDAALLAAATRAGLVCLGKTHMTELAFSGLGINPVTATPPNINDAERAPGGSSSGAAASVAFGLAPAAIGSDTGGSIRVPAAWNDLVGFKPGWGRLPMAGVVPLAPRFDTAGPITRTVEDAALLWAALAGGPAPDLREAEIADMVFLIPEADSLAETETPVVEAIEAACARLEGAGARILRRPIAAADQAMALAPALFAPEAYAHWGAAIEADPEAMFPPVRDRFRSGAEVSAVAYLRAWIALDAARHAWRRATAGFDAVLLPSVAILPPPVLPLLDDHDRFSATNLMALRNTRLANLLDLCAISLPAGTPSVGLMAMLPGGEEARLLRVAKAIDGALAGPA